LGPALFDFYYQAAALKKKKNTKPASFFFARVLFFALAGHLFFFCGSCYLCCLLFDTHTREYGVEAGKKQGKSASKSLLVRV